MTDGGSYTSPAHQASATDQSPFAAYGPGGDSTPYPAAGYADPYPTAYPVADFPAAAYPVAGYQGYGSGLQEHPQAMTVLVLGLMSVLMPVLGPFAWWYGSRARRQIRQNPALYQKSASLTVGWVIGIVVTIGWVLGFLVFGFLFFVVFTTMSTVPPP